MQPLNTYLGNLTYSCLLLCMAVTSVAMLAVALIGQYGFGWHPCELCLMQRYPYVGVIIFGLGGYFLKSKPAIQQAFIAVCILLFLTTAGIAAYHSAVEMKWIAGPSACSSASTAGMTLEELRKQIMEAPLVSCDQAMAYIFGLSLATWNMLAALSFAIVSGSMMLRIKKRRS